MAEIANNNSGTMAVHPVESCNLGKIGAHGIALKINFPGSDGGLKGPSTNHAVFGLSQELAHGLLKALTAILEQPAGTARH